MFISKGQLYDPGMDFVAIPDKHKPTQLIGLKEVMRRVQRSRSTIYRWMDLGIFPKQAKKEGGTTSALWFADEVDAFIAALRSAPSGPLPSSLSLTPVRHTNTAQNAVEIRITSQSQKLVAKQNKPVLPKSLRPLGTESKACLIVGPLLIGTQEAFFDSESGRIFEVIGQLAIRQPRTVSRSVQKHWQADDAGDRQ